jgi:two-component system, OmpR family, response regulator
LLASPLRAPARASSLADRKRRAGDPPVTVVLIVDVDPDRANAFAAVLERQGIAVTRVSSAHRSAIEVACQLRAWLGGPAVPEAGPRTVQVGDLVVDVAARRARRGKMPLELAPREFDLLLFLVRHAGRIVDRATLFGEVWRYRHDRHSNVVEAHVARLRRKLKAAGGEPMIHTVRGLGYVVTDDRR